MENIFVVLAIIGSVIYKIYTSYQEEQEKAAKRKQPARPIPSPEPVQQQRRPTPPPPPVVRSRPVPPPIKKTPPAVPYEVPNEVRRVQQAKLERERKPVLQVEEKTSETFQFDLRKAVIQSAILERPYQ